jgi:hypothetical protein
MKIFLYFTGLDEYDEEIESDDKEYIFLDDNCFIIQFDEQTKELLKNNEVHKVSLKVRSPEIMLNLQDQLFILKLLKDKNFLTLSSFIKSLI